MTSMAVYHDNVLYTGHSCGVQALLCDCFGQLGIMLWYQQALH